MRENNTINAYTTINPTAVKKIDNRKSLFATIKDKRNGPAAYPAIVTTFAVETPRPFGMRFAKIAIK